MSTVFRILILSFLILPNLVAGGLLYFSRQQSHVADFLGGPTPTRFSEKDPFLAQGKLVSPKGLSLKSPHQEQECVAYRTRVELVHERWEEEPDGDEVRKTGRSVIFDEKANVDDLTVRFEGGGSAALRLDEVENFHSTVRETLEDWPEYVPDVAVAVPSAANVWYEASEDTFTAEQPVFIAGVKTDGALTKHPKLGELIVYTGPREDYVARLRDSGASMRRAAGLISAVSIIMAGLLYGIFRFIVARSAA